MTETIRSYRLQELRPTVRRTATTLEDCRIKRFFYKRIGGVETLLLETEGTHVHYV